MSRYGKPKTHSIIRVSYLPKLVNVVHLQEIIRQNPPSSNPPKLDFKRCEKGIPENISNFIRLNPYERFSLAEAVECTMLSSIFHNEDAEDEKLEFVVVALSGYHLGSGSVVGYVLREKERTTVESWEGIRGMRMSAPESVAAVSYSLW